MAPDALFNRLIDALRRVWRGGHGTADDVRLGIDCLRELHARAGVTREVALVLSESVIALERLPSDESARRQRVEQLATSLKAIQPFFGLAEKGPEVGKLNSALGERRAGRPTPPPRASAPVQSLPIDAPITRLPRVGPKVAEKLEKLNIATVEDALRLIPRRHIDYSNLARIGNPLGLHGDVTIGGEVVEIREQQGGGRPRVNARISDGTGTMRIVWFNSFVAKQLAPGERIYVSGRVQGGYSGLEMVSPEWEKADGPNLSTGRLIPVYPATQGVAQKSLRAMTRAALDATRARLVDWLAEAKPFIDPEVWEQLPALDLAYEHLHYPNSLDEFTTARHRLSFENLLLLQIGLIKRKHSRKAVPGQPFEIDSGAILQFRETLPFTLTRAQDNASTEILRDLRRPEPMSRLLQGDVGSGKTVVAAIAALIARGNGKQTAIMAPTELLAEQHFRSFTSLYASLPEERRPSVALLTGSTRASARRTLVEPLATGTLDILVGTHALIQNDLEFHDLALAIIDEQHRFGVRQRASLTVKAAGPAPHVLAMTATPIPRTLNMVLAGDLDVSIIDELPPGRIPIETRRFVGNERGDAYRIVREQITAGHQAFVICPLVEDSELIDARSAIEEAVRLQRDVFPDLRVDVVHGKMPAKKKDEVMTAFRDR
ncbi:MAG: ATP-dependent DNA helicase RecG, partial [Chloroflexia bacterium]|nr:ATP-dependent DNA helicase RecG [Chloroflexia bacterium]